MCPRTECNTALRFSAAARYFSSIFGGPAFLTDPLWVWILFGASCALCSLNGRATGDHTTPFFICKSLSHSPDSCVSSSFLLPGWFKRRKMYSFMQLRFNVARFKLREHEGNNSSSSSCHWVITEGSSLDPPVWCFSSFKLHLCFIIQLTFDFKRTNFILKA